MTLQTRSRRAGLALPRASTLYEWILRRATLIWIGGGLALLLVLGSVTEFNVLRDWQPQEDQALQNAWQIHAAFTSIAFAGLAIAFQVLSDPPLTAGPARRAVVDQIRYPLLLAQGIGANLLLGIASTWLQSDVTVFISFVLILTPSVLLTTWAYLRLGKLFSHPHRLERLTLDDLKRRTVTALRDYTDSAKPREEHSQELETRDFLDRRVPPEARILKSRTVRHAGRTGIVTQIRYSAFDNAAEVLRSPRFTAAITADQTPDKWQLTKHIDQVYIALYVSPGDRVHHNTVLAEVFWSGNVWNVHRLQQLENMRRAIRIDEEAIDLGEQLREEVSDLQDSIIQAIHARQLARVRRGLGYFMEVLREVDAHSAASSNEDPTRWRWIESQGWELEAVAAEVSDRTAILVTQEAAGRAKRAIESADNVALAKTMASYVHIWEQLTTSTDPASRNAREHLLTSLHTLTELYIPMRSAKGQPLTDAAAQCVWAYVELVKTAWDAGATVDAHRAAGYLAGLFEFAKDDFRVLRREVNAGLVALCAWAMYVRRNKADTEAPDETPLLNKIEPQAVLPALVALRGHDGPAARWTFWETEGSLPFRAQALTLERYAERVAILALRSIKELSLATDEEYAVAKSIESEFESLQSEGPDAPIPLDQLEHLEGMWRRAIAEWVKERQLAEAKLPVDDSKYNTFLESFIKVFKSDPRPATMFTSRPKGELDETGEAKVLYLNLRVPRSFFIETPRVFADPRQLGSSMAIAMLRTEAQSVIDHCHRVGVSKQATIESATTDIEQLSGAMKRPLLMVLDSGQLEEIFMGESSEYVVDGRTIPVLRMLGVECDEHLVLVDLDAAPLLERTPEKKKELASLDDIDVALGLFEDVGPAQDGEPLVRVETGVRMQWSMPAVPAVFFLRVEDVEW